jgi:hypothetical protein
MSLTKCFVGLVLTLVWPASVCHATDLSTNETRRHPSTIEELINDSEELLANSPPASASAPAVTARPTVDVAPAEPAPAPVHPAKGYLYLILGCLALGAGRAIQYRVCKAENGFGLLDTESGVRHPVAKVLPAQALYLRLVGSSGPRSARSTYLTNATFGRWDLS